MESIFLQVLRECLNFIPVILSTPQPGSILTNLTEAPIYPLYFQGGHPWGYSVGNISTPCNHTFILTFPPGSKQHWNSTNQTIQAAVKHKKTSPLKYLSFLVFKIQMPDKPLFNHRYRQYFHFYRMGLTKHLWKPLSFCTITGLGTKKKKNHFLKVYAVSSIHRGKLGSSDPCGGRLGIPVASNTTPPITLHADSYGASLPPSQGLFCMCVSSAYMRLPPQWKGKCSLGYMHENLYLKMSNHLKAS